MKNRLTLAAALLAPATVFAHHGGEESIAGQLIHASFDPLHLGLTLIVVAGLYGLVKTLAKAGKAR